jgi:DNA polymerase-3 subunit epsilon
MARETFPGKSNSLDALCKRLEVDNSNRALHGALIDAALLAEVYIRLTRGQDTLGIDLGGGDPPEPGSAAALAAAVDLASFDLPVLEASAAEQAAHESMLLELDKASGGKTLWRTIAPSMA